jgi:hypothetical protein
MADQTGDNGNGNRTADRLARIETKLDMLLDWRKDFEEETRRELSDLRKSNRAWDIFNSAAAAIAVAFGLGRQ